MGGNWQHLQEILRHPRQHLHQKMQMKMCMAMKREALGERKQHSKGLGIGIKGGGFAGQHKCGRSLVNALYLRCVFASSFSSSVGTDAMMRWYSLLLY